MRILKRNLAFVLALVMTLSLTVSAAGVEDYTDVNDITFGEAVDVLTEMGILEGTDGAFNPTDILTREQAAKIIAYMLLGKSAADNLNVAKAPFDDVPANRWSAGYVAYCASQNIVGGYGDGNFGPKDQLTGTQFAKMLLCAVGYGVNGEFTGVNWESEVNAQALKLGVFDGNLGVNFSEACTREEAALYAFNALWNIDTVNYSELFGTYYAGKSVLDNEGAQTLNEALYDFDTKDDEDAFGRQGYVYINAKNKEVTGLYGNEAEAVYTAKVKSGTIYADLGLSEKAVATVIVNGDTTYEWEVKKNSKTEIGGNGVLVEAYVENDDVTLVVIDTYLAVVDGDAENGEVTVDVYYAADATAVQMTYETEVEYKDGDYVLVTVEKDGTDSIQSMVLAETVVGELTAYSSASKYIKIDDEKYNLHADLNNSMLQINYDATMAAILDENGYVIGLVVEEEAEVADGYVWVVKGEARESDLFTGEAAVVKVMYLDGTGYEVLPMATKTVNNKTQVQTSMGVNKLEWHDIDVVNHENLFLEGFYGYYMNEDGEITLMELKDTAVGTKAATEAQILNGVLSADGGESQKMTLGTTVGTMVKYMNSDTVLNVVTKDNVTTYEGYKKIEIDETDADALVLYSGNVVEEVYIVDGAVVESDIYAYYNGGTYNDTDGDQWVTVFMNGESKDFEVATNKTLTQGIWKIKVDGTKLTDLTVVTAEPTKDNDLFAAARVTTAKNLYFTINGTANYYAEDVKVYNVTDGGAEATIAKNDYVVFAKNADGLVNYAYIIGAYDSDITENEDVVVETGIKVTPKKTATAATFAVEGLNTQNPEKVTITVFNYNNGVNAIYDVIEVTPKTFVDGVWTYTYTTDIEGQLSFNIEVGTALVCQYGPVSFVK